MEPMKPMKPMKPMEPMKAPDPWWPSDLGEPSTTGGQNDSKYAYFADSHRLAVSQSGDITLYDTGQHEITGVAQDEGDPTFTTSSGSVPLGELQVV